MWTYYCNVYENTDLAYLQKQASLIPVQQQVKKEQQNLPSPIYKKENIYLQNNSLPTPNNQERPHNPKTNYTPTQRILIIQYEIEINKKPGNQINDYRVNKIMYLNIQAAAQKNVGLCVLLVGNRRVHKETVNA